MSVLVSLIIGLCILGVVLWLVESVIPMPAWLKTVLRVAIALVVIIWLLQLLHVVPGGFGQ